MSQSHSRLIDEVECVWREAEQLYNAAQVDALIAQLGARLGARLRGTNPLCLCVMNGGLVFTGKLLPHLDFPLELDYIHATRYRDQTRGQTLHWQHQPQRSLRQRTLLVLDDILDEGLTLRAVLDYCHAAGAGEVVSAVMADKQHPRAPGGLARADFSAFQVPDRYVFGYGLDYKGYLRNAAGIYAVRGI